MILIAIASDAKDLDVIHNQLFVTGAKLSTQGMEITAQTLALGMEMNKLKTSGILTTALTGSVRMWNVKLNKSPKT